MATTSLRRVRVIWTGVAGTPYITNLYFENQAGKAGATKTNVEAWLNTMKNYWVPALKAQQESEQTIIDVVSGLATGTEDGGATAQYVGLSSSDPLPWATQGVVRLKTNAFNNGRRLQGRLFIPGPGEGNSDGLPASLYRSGVDTQCATLLTSSAASGVWAVYSRRYQAWANVLSATCWSQWGVQRRRRD